MTTTSRDKAVTFINGARDADIWILPDTQENRKTTLWGTATASKVKTDESRLAPLCEEGDNGRYLLRMIDTDGFYYAADSITLQDGWTLRIYETDVMASTLEVTDGSGVKQGTYEVFCARL